MTARACASCRHHRAGNNVDHLNQTGLTGNCTRESEQRPEPQWLERAVTLSDMQKPKIGKNWCGTIGKFWELADA